MKKLLVLLLVLVLACSIFASCDKKPAGDNADQNPPVNDNAGEVEDPTDEPADLPTDEPADNPGGDVTDTPDDDNKEDVPPPHEHSFEVVEEKQPTCLVAGTVTLVSSGNSDRRVLERSELRDELKRKRAELAEKMHLLPFMIFNDAVLEELILKMPLTTAEALRIKGIGERKAEMLQKNFLPIIEKYRQENLS